MQTIVELLRFVGLAREPRRRVSLYSGLPLSRVHRILGGRTLARPNELRKLLSLVGVDSLAPVFTPLVESASSGQDATLRIDALTALFEPRGSVQDCDSQQLAKDRRTHWYRSKSESAYWESCKIAESILLQRRPKNSAAPPYRLEIKGRAFQDRDALATRLGQLVSLFDFDRCRLSRLDVAIDLPASVSDLLFVHPTARTVVVYPQFGGSTNYYMGSRRSKRSICVYGKRLDEGGSGPSARIEIRLNPPVVTLHALEHLPNPFDDISLFVASTKADRGHVEMLLRYGDLAGAAVVRRTAPRMAGALVDCASDVALAFWHPRAVFDRHWANEARWLLAATTNGARQ